MANKKGAIVVGVVSLLFLGTAIFFVIKGINANKKAQRNKKSDDKKVDGKKDENSTNYEQQNTIINTSLKGVDLTRGGSYIPTKDEFDAWKKANPFNFSIPSLSEMLKGTDKLKIGEIIPKKQKIELKTTSTYSSVDQNKIAQWQKDLGIK